MEAAAAVRSAAAQRAPGPGAGPGAQAHAGASAAALPGPAAGAARLGAPRLARTATAADVEELLRRGRAAGGHARSGSHGSIQSLGGAGAPLERGGAGGGLARGGSGGLAPEARGGGAGGGTAGRATALARGGSGTYPGGAGGASAGPVAHPLRSHGSAGSLANLARRCRPRRRRHLQVACLARLT